MLNLVYPIYNNSKETLPTPIEKVIEFHVDTWRSYSNQVRQEINIILVDDGSKVPIKVDIKFPLNFTLARIQKDIYWNISGAQNLGHKLATNGWIFSSDIDHVLMPGACEKILSLDKKRKVVYCFTRNLIRKKQSPNTFLIHKEDYWSFGGYDEDFAGNGGWNDEMFKALIKNQKFDFSHTNIEVEFHPEFISTNEKKGRCNNGNKMARKMKQIEAGTYENKKQLRFEWTIVKKQTYNNEG